MQSVAAEPYAFTFRPSTAACREANDRGFDCLVLEDCTGSYFPEFQQAGIAMIQAQGGGIFGWVAPSAALLDALT